MAFKLKAGKSGLEKRRKTWRFLRLFFTGACSTFFVSALLLLLYPLSCMTDVLKKQTFYPTHSWTFSCWSMPHIIWSAFDALIAIALCFCSFLFALSQIDSRPTLGFWYSYGNPKLEVTITVIKIIFVICPFIVSWRSIFEGAAYFILSTAYLYFNAKLLGLYQNWMNRARVGLAAVVFWMSLVLLWNILQEQDAASAFDYPDYAITFGSAAALCLGVGLAFLREFQLDARKYVHKSQEDDTLICTKDISDPFEVEYLARIVRTQPNDENLICVGEAVFQAGIEKYPDDAFLQAAYFCFIEAYRPQLLSQCLMLDRAKRSHPNVVTQYVIFMKQKERESLAQSDATGDSVVDYVEFQHSFDVIQRSIETLLGGVRSFWKACLQGANVDDLAKRCEKLRKKEEDLDKSFAVLLTKYPKSVKLIRSYARFMGDVKNDPWTATKYLTEADKLENSMTEERRKTLAGGGGIGSGAFVDDKTDAVIITDESGLIKFANDQVSALFGVKSGALLGRNVIAVMPPPYSTHHHEFLSAYKRTGVSRVLGRTRVFSALHSEGYTFQIEVAANRTETDQGTNFVAAIRGLDDDGTCIVTFDSSGTVFSFNKSTLEMLGYRSEELSKKNVSLLVNSEADLVKICADYADDPSAKERKCYVNLYTKGGKRVICSYIAQQHMVSKTAMTQISFAEKEDVAGNLRVNNDGIIVSYDATFSNMLNYAAGELGGKELWSIMEAPMSKHHAQLFEKRGNRQLHLCPITNKQRVPFVRADGSRLDVVCFFSYIVDPATGSKLFNVRSMPIDVANEEGLNIGPCNGLIFDGVLRDDGAERVILSSSYLNDEVYQGRTVESVVDADPSFLGVDLSDLASKNGSGSILFATSAVPKVPMGLLLVEDGLPEPDGEHLELSQLFRVQIFDIFAMDAIMHITHNGTIKQIDRNIQILFGYSPQRLIGSNLNMLMATGVGSRHDGFLSRYWSSGKKDLYRRVPATQAQHRSGQLFPMLVDVAQVADQNFDFVGRIVPRKPSTKTSTSGYTSRGSLKSGAKETASESGNRSETARSTAQSDDERGAPAPVPLEAAPSVNLPGSVDGDAHSEAASEGSEGLRKKKGSSFWSDPALEGKDEGEDALKTKVLLWKKGQEDDGGDGDADDERDGAPDEPDSEGEGSIQIAEAAPMEGGGGGGEKAQDEFDRSRRFGAILKTLNRAGAKSSLETLRARSKYSFIVLLIIYLVFFATFRTNANLITARAARVLGAGDALYAMQAVAAYARYFEMLRDAVMPARIQNMAVDLDAALRKIYLSLWRFDSSTRILYEAPTLETTLRIGLAVRGRTSLWQIGRRILTAALLVSDANATAAASSPEARFLHADALNGAMPAYEGVVLVETQRYGDAIASFQNLFIVGTVVFVVVDLAVVACLLSPVLESITSERRKIFLSFLALPAAEIRPLTRRTFASDGADAKAATKPADLSDDEFDLDDVDATVGKKKKPRVRWMLDKVLTAKRLTKQLTAKVVPAQPSDVPAQPSAAGGWFRAFCDRVSAVAANISMPAFISRDAVQFAAIVLSMALIAILSCVISALLIARTGAPLIEASAASRSLYYATRVRYFSQELLYNPPANRSAIRDKINAAAAYSNELARVITFGSADLGLEGFAFRSGDMAYLLFDQRCFSDNSTRCDDKTSPTYVLTQSGFYSVLQYYLDQARLLTNDSDAALLTTARRFREVESLGDEEVVWGLRRARSLLFGEIFQFLSFEAAASSVLFVALVLALGFSYFKYSQRFTHKVQKETKIAASLLSWVPAAPEIVTAIIFDMDKPKSRGGGV
jgi:PAS domain S-box-containing protein